MSVLDEALEQYQVLVNSVEESFTDLKEQYPQQINCKMGCHQCCQPNLSVSGLEGENIQRYLKNNPTLIEQLKQLEVDNPHNGTRCSLLGKNGACQIYPVRPIICRSHGAAILFHDAGQWFADICELNNLNLEKLPQEDFLIIDWLNNYLAQFNIDAGFSAARIPLRVQDILQE